MQNTYTRYPIILSLLLLQACGGYSASQLKTVETQIESQVSAKNSDGDYSSIKTNLDFSGVLWPATLPAAEKPPFEIALDLSGTYEGSLGWSNLTNNFDGQGLSMGLLNQTLGTGSLEPLLLQMKTKFSARMIAIFSAANYQSLTGMLSVYQNSTHISSVVLRAPASIQPPEHEQTLSPLDIESDQTMLTGSFQPFAQSSTPQSAAVQWAVKTLYSGSSFKADWKTQLNVLGNDLGYISVQIAAAQNILNQARKYQLQFNLPDLRSFLFFFDVCVQNGSLYSSDITAYQAWVKTYATLPSVQSRLTEILNLRLRHVKAQYVSDVQSRKLAIIQGQGKVHGSNRDLLKEYGVPLTTIVP